MADITVSTDIDALISSADNAAARTSLELGATDTVEFGAFIPPAGTTAEIDALFAGSLAVPGSLYLNTEEGSQWLAVTSSVRKMVSGKTGYAAAYFVDGKGGDDSTGLLNDSRLPFKTITAAFNAMEADTLPSVIVDFYIISGSAYDEVDVMANVTKVGLTVRVHCDRGTLFSSTGSGAVFDNTTNHVNFAGIFGSPSFSSSYTGVIYAGDAYNAGSGGSTFQFGSVQCGSTTGILKITGGTARISADQIDFSTSGRLFLSAANATIILDVVDATYSSISIPPNRLVEVSGTTHCTIMNARTKNCVWASLLDATAIVVIQNCVHWRATLGDSMLAAVPTSNVFFLGDSGSVIALPANITPNLTFGTYTVSADSDKLIPIAQ